MFYLVEFFKSLGESFVRGFFFFFFSCFLAFSLTHRSWIAEIVHKVTPEKIVNPYVVAVVDSTLSTDAFKASIQKLPGVLNFEEKSQAEAQGKISNLISKLGSDYSVSNDLLGFKTIRISLNPALSKESLEYVRTQMVKFGGKDHQITASQVKYPEIAKVMNSHPFYKFLSSAGEWGVIGILSLCWIVSYWLCYDLFRSRSYVIEKFQRKTLVASKTIASGLSVVVCLFFALGLLNGTLKILDTVVLFMIFSIFWTFSMQEWRWKPTL